MDPRGQGERAARALAPQRGTASRIPRSPARHEALRADGTPISVVVGAPDRGFDPLTQD